MEGCISTPIPNYLSTHLSLPLNHKTTHKRVEERRAEQCGKGSDVEQMRRMVRSVEMVRLSGLVC